MGCCGPRQAADYDCDAEGLSESDLARFGGDEAVCRGCGETYYADAAMCPRCGRAALASEEQGAGGGMRSFVVPGVVVLMIVLLLAISL